MAPDLRAVRFEITDDWWEEYANVAVGPFVRAAIPDADDALVDRLLEEGNALFLDALHLLEPIEHVVAIARAHHGRLPMAVVTGGFRDVVVPSLDTVGITDLFDVIVTADDVTDSKPAPDLYLRAMELIGVAPRRVRRLRGQRDRDGLCPGGGHPHGARHPARVTAP